MNIGLASFFGESPCTNPTKKTGNRETQCKALCPGSGFLVQNYFSIF